jgi:hypothetical protein
MFQAVILQADALCQKVLVFYILQILPRVQKKVFVVHNATGIHRD